MKNIFIILFAALFAIGCSDDPTQELTQPETQIEVSTAQMSFYSTGDVMAEGENTLTVTCSDVWRLSGKKTWCKPSSIEGKSGEKVTFTAEPNPLSEQRSVTYTFICGSKIQRVVVTQEPSSVLDFITDKVYNLGHEIGSVAVIVKATEDLTYEIAAKDKTWITSNNSRSSQTKFLSFTVAANPDFKPRSGSIIFRVKGKVSELTVNQAQTDHWEFPKTVYEVDPEGEQVTVDYSANVEVVPDLTGYSWITLVPSTPPTIDGVTPGKLIFNIEKVDKDLRVAKIPIKSTNKVTVYATLSFSQAPAPVTATVTDKKFGDWLIAQGYVTFVKNNKYALTVKGLTVENINCSSQDISSVAGIESFETLTNFNCSNNAITALDMSKNKKLVKLNCSTNNLTSLDISGNSLLTNLNCSNNELSTVDMRGCPLLTITSSSSSPTILHKNRLGTIYIADNGAMTRFYLNEVSATPTPLTSRSGVVSNKLTFVGQNIERIYINNIKTMSEVDVSACPNLSHLYANGGIAKTVYISPQQKPNEMNWTGPITYKIIP